MNKVYGKKSGYAPVREDTSRIIASYGMEPVADPNYATWYEVYFYKKQKPSPTKEDIHAAIINDINARVKDSIISGFVWNDKPVWLSEENQMNFAQGVAPVMLKIGEEPDRTPIYQDFETAEQLKAFSDACSIWKQQCLQAGWSEKDSIDWSQYDHE